MIPQPAEERRMVRRRSNRTWQILLLVGAMVLTLAPAATSASAAETQAAASLYEAEDATIFEGQVNSDHPGFTGTGFVNYDNVVGSYVESAVSVPAAGSYTLTFRYANGTSTNRPMDIAVNGSVTVPNLAFNPTGTWDNWTNQTTTVDLVAGTNTIRATATTSNGGPNLDSMTVASGGGGGGTDWSTAVVNSTMTRYTPGTLGG